MAVLRTAISTAIAGRGATVLVAGEAGIGKTALATHATEAARAAGAVVAWGRSAEGPGAAAYWPWTQVLRDLSNLGVDEHAGQRQPAQDRFALFEGVLRSLEEAGAGSGLVVVLDDLHWADTDSLRLLEFAARQLAGSRVLLIGTYRDTEGGAELRRVAGAAEVLQLGGLSVAAVADLMAAVSGAGTQPDDVEAMRKRTGGNPLFVRELTRLLATQRHGDNRAATIGVVDSVRDVIERRQARLTQPCADLLGLAALDGPVVRAWLLQRALADDVDVTALIDEALVARVLSVDESGAPRFAHDIFREVLATTHGVAATRHGYLMLGRAMESARADGVMVDPAELAAQFTMATSAGAPAAAEPAVRYSREAASDAAHRFAWNEAARHLEHALAAAEQTGLRPEHRLDLLLELAAAQRSAGRLASAKRTYLDAYAIARHVGDTTAQARAAIGLHGVGAKTGPSVERDTQTALLDAVARVLPAEHPLAADVQAALARSLYHSFNAKRMAQAATVARRAVDVARATGDDNALAAALLAEHDVHWAPGRAAERVAILDRLSDAPAHVELLRGAALLELGEPSGRTHIQTFCAHAERTGSPTDRWVARSRQAALALLSGQLEETASLLDTAESIATAIGDDDALFIADIQRWELARFRGGRGTYRRRYPHHDPPVESWPPWPALILADAAELPAATSALAGFTAEEAFGPQVETGYDLWFPSIAADAAARCGTETLRAAMYELLAGYSGTHISCGACVAYAGPVDYYLGALAHTLGDTARARTHLTAAAEQCRRLAAPLWLDLVHAADTAPPPEPEPGTNLFRRVGAAWDLRFAGRQALIPDARGLADIAALLARPHQGVPAIDLAGRPRSAPGQPALDRRAVEAYRARLRDLDDEITSAEADHDNSRANSRRDEREALLEELRRSFGRAGRSRRLDDDTEKARQTVSARIHRALRTIERQHPALAAHLRDAIDTGTTCTYRPPAPIDWQL